MISVEERDEIIASAVTEFWKQSYPVLVKMVGEMLPFQVELQDYLKAHPDAMNVEYISAALDEKRKNPNSDLIEILERIRVKNAGG